VTSYLRSDIWVGAFARRHNDQGRFCVVERRGDPIAGQIFILVDHLDRTQSLFTPAPATAEAGADRRFQRRFSRDGSEKVRERIAQEMRFDPDLWVIAIDSRDDDLGIDVVA